ncbi:MAG: OmpA family protein [Caulobacteraceae bacterium]
MNHRTRPGVAFAVLAAAALSGCASVDRLRVRGVSPCRTTTATLYFDAGADDLSPPAQAVVAATAHQLKGCRVQELQLLGLADPAGVPQTNLELSQRRAEHVLAAFVKAGLPVPKYTLTAAGANGSVTASGEVEPVRRRVDVNVVVR